MAYRNYSDDEKAAALAHYEVSGSLRKTATAFKMPVSVLHLWVKKPNAPSAPSSECVQEKRRALADLFEDLAYQAVGHSSDTMELAKPGEAALIAAQAVDKMRLLREQATSISQVNEPKTIEEVQEQARVLAEKHGLKLIAEA